MGYTMERIGYAARYFLRFRTVPIWVTGGLIWMLEKLIWATGTRVSPIDV